MFSSTAAKNDLHWRIVIFILSFNKVVHKCDVIQVEFLQTKKGKVFDVSQLQKIAKDTIVCESTARLTKVVITVALCMVATENPM